MEEENKQQDDVKFANEQVSIEANNQPTFLMPPTRERGKQNNKGHILALDADVKVECINRSRSDEEKEKAVEEEIVQVESEGVRLALMKVIGIMKDAVYESQEEKRLLTVIENKVVDPTPNFVEGIFLINQTNICMRCCSKRRSSLPDKIQIYDYRSLYCLHFTNRFRIELVNFTQSTVFENFIILLIFMNSMVLAIYDYNDRENENAYNQRLEIIGQVFTVFFTFEMLLKILAQGFIIHYNAYLRDGWNWLDFIVVFTGIMEMMEVDWFKVQALRTLRVLRPLRSIKAYPKMRLLVQSLVGSVSSLLNAVIFMLFIFMLFGILGVQQFQGSMYHRCRFTEYPLEDGTWPIDEEIEDLCSPDGQGFIECPVDRFCKQPADAGLSSNIDSPKNDSHIFYNMIGFDNLAWAMLTIFQMITLEQWTTVMYLLMDSNIWWMGMLFCVILVLIGSFFLLNVILAVLADALNMVEQWRIKHDSVRLNKIRQSLDRAEEQHARLPKNQFQRTQSMCSNLFGKVIPQEKEISDEDSNDRDSRIADVKISIEQVDSFKLVQNNKIMPINEDSLPDKSEANSDSELSDVSCINEEYAIFADPNEKTAKEFQEDQQEDVKDALELDRHNKRYSNQLTARSELIVAQRNSSNKIYLICYKVCIHWAFNGLIFLLIIANTVLLALEKYPEDASVEQTAHTLNEIFTWAFAIEMIIKLIGLGFRSYARDTFNIFDATIVILSVVDLVISKTFEDDSGTSELTAFRGVRLLRIFKLARSWKSFRIILSKILITIKDVSTFSVLLLLFMFIFSLLGMELFGYRVLFHNDLAMYPDDPLFREALPPRPNFDNLGMSITSIFAVAIGDDWNLFMAMAYRAQGFIAIAFYPIVFIFMNLVLLNLFLAILLQNFETREERVPQDGLQDEKAFRGFLDRIKLKYEPLLNRLTEFFSCCYVRDEEEDEEDSEKQSSSFESSSSQNESHSIENNQDGSDNEKTKKGDLTRRRAVLIVNQNLMSDSKESENQKDADVNFSGTNNLKPDDIAADAQAQDSNNLDSDRSQAEQRGEMKIFVPKKTTSDTSRRNSSFMIRSRTKFLQKAVRTLQSKIPEQYNRKNFRKVMKVGQTNRHRLHELEQSSLMLTNSDKHMSLAWLKRMELNQRNNKEKKHIKMIGRSLFCFSRHNCLRKICFQIIKHPWYDSAVLALIAISTVLLCLDNPNMDQAGDLAQLVSIFDYILTSLFTIECLVNIILFGMICNGPTSYARDPWNVMDLLIVIFSILTLILQGQGGADLSILKIFRMLRVLRPLRVLKRNLGLKIQVVSLLKSIPSIANLLIISSLILMIFGIQAVAMLKGTFYYCSVDNVPEYAVAGIKTKWDCFDYGGDWINNEDNFDNVLNAMVTMFGMMTTEGWLDVMWSAVDSTNINQVPQRNNKLEFIAFFSIFMIIGSLFLLNLFVGVVINTFNIEKEKLLRNALMTDLQDEYCEVLIKCYKLKPLKKAVLTGNKCRDTMIQIAQHQAFEIFIFICICLNTIVLALSWNGMDQQIVDVLEILNYIFTVIYTIEMIIKMVAFRKGYFTDSWCIFDCIIVISALIGIVLLRVFNIDVGSITTIIRSFRIARVLKLIKTAKNLDQIFQTFMLAIPELINVGALLLLFLLLFSVLGVSLFGDVKPQEVMNRHSGFSNFGYANLTLLRVATGEGWVGIMRDAARQPSIMFNCIYNQSYESKVRDGIQGCGNSAAYIYFVAFIMMVSLVFLNLFIAIILEGFAASASEQKIRVGDECFEAFARAWQKYDPDATEIILATQLEMLILDLVEEELKFIDSDSTVRNVNFNLHKFRILKYYTKWQRNVLNDEDRKSYFQNIELNKPRQNALRRYMQQYIKDLQIPLYFGLQKIQFHDTLNAIIKAEYRKITQMYVEDRQSRIKTKQEVGERLMGLESIKVGSRKFWRMSPLMQEEILQRTEPDFQKVVNRLENKGQTVGQEIFKLNLMRLLRKRAGARYSKNLAMDLEKHIYDSSHFIGAQVILKTLRNRKQGNLERQKTKKIFASFGSSLKSPRDFTGDNVSVNSPISTPKFQPLPYYDEKFVQNIALGFRNQTRTQNKITADNDSMQQTGFVDRSQLSPYKEDTTLTFQYEQMMMMPEEQNFVLDKDESEKLDQERIDDEDLASDESVHQKEKVGSNIIPVKVLQKESQMKKFSEDKLGPEQTNSTLPLKSAIGFDIKAGSCLEKNYTGRKNQRKDDDKILFVDTQFIQSTRADDGGGKIPTVEPKKTMQLELSSKQLSITQALKSDSPCIDIKSKQLMSIESPKSTGHNKPMLMSPMIGQVNISTGEDKKPSQFMSKSRFEAPKVVLNRNTNEKKKTQERQNFWFPGQGNSSPPVEQASHAEQVQKFIDTTVKITSHSLVKNRGSTKSPLDNLQETEKNLFGANLYHSSQPLMYNLSSSAWSRSKSFGLNNARKQSTTPLSMSLSQLEAELMQNNKTPKNVINLATPNDASIEEKRLYKSKDISMSKAQADRITKINGAYATTRPTTMQQGKRRDVQKNRQLLDAFNL